MSDEQEQGPKQLRDALDRLKAENEELQAFRVKTIFDQSGLDPTKGIGKAIAKDIERGDYSGEFSADALKDYAQNDYGWEPTPEAPPTPQPKTPQQVAQEGQERLDKLGDHQTPPPPPEDLATKQAQSQGEGDHINSIRAGVAALLAGND